MVSPVKFNFFYNLNRYEINTAEVVALGSL